MKHVGCALDLHKQDAQARNSNDRRGMRTLDENQPILVGELGAMLWYAAVIASAYGLSLERIASENLQRTSTRYCDGNGLTCPNFDHGYQAWEIFPRRIVIRFSEVQENDRTLAKLIAIAAEPNAFGTGTKIVKDKAGNDKEQGYRLGAQLGHDLTDNSRRADGYRYHDAIHMAFMAVLHWSPVMRVMLQLKRRSNATTDENEDGARAQFTEEAIAAALAGFSVRRVGFEKPQTVDGEVLDVVKTIANGFEVKSVPDGLWRRAISQGFLAMKQLKENSGGYLTADLDDQVLVYSKQKPVGK